LITKGQTTPLVRRPQKTTWSVLCQSHSICAPRASAERASCFHVLAATPRRSSRACVEMPLEGVPECCSGARSRKDKRHHWFGGRGRPPGACCAKATASVRHVQVPSERLAFTCSPRLHAAQVGHLKACRSVALALDHERARDTTGSAAVADHLERAVPKPRRLCATCKCRASVLLSTARHGSTPRQSGVRGDAS
jgi:hypothetical protein